MNNRIRRLVGQTGVYAFGNVLLKFGGLLIIPVYLNVLTPDEYGRFVLLEVTARVAIMLVGMGISKGLLKFITGDEIERGDSVLSFTALTAVLMLASISAVALWTTAPSTASVVLGDSGQAVLIELMAVFIAVKVVQSVPLMILRVRERAALYVSASVGEVVILIGAVYWFVVYQELGLEGVMTAYVVSSSAVTLILLTGVFRRLRIGIRYDLIKRLIKFGAPLTIASLAGLFMNIGDRYLIKIFGTIEMVAQYDWAARLCGVINMFFVQSFQLAFAVIGLKSRANTREGANLYQETFRHFTFWCGWSVLGLSLLSLDLTLLISDRPEYQLVDQLVFPVSMGFMAYGLYYVAVNVLYTTGKTKSIAGMVLVSAVLNAVLNIILLPVIGVMGAALATAVAYAALAAIAHLTSRREIAVRYPWSLLAWVIVALTGLFFLGQISTAWPAPQRLLYRGGIILLYPAIFLASGLYRPKSMTEFVLRLRKSAGIDDR